MKKILFLLLTVFTISCQTITETGTTGFSLKGKTHGLEDGTKILLHSIDAGQVIDSTLIKKHGGTY